MGVGGGRGKILKALEYTVQGQGKKQVFCYNSFVFSLNLMPSNIEETNEL